jgi:dTDP-4-amino-4,6-dideoxygalactose transaminase
MHRIPLSYTEIDIEGLAEVLKRYAGRSHQDIIPDFEKQIAELIGVRYVVALNSGTAALHLALKALQVGSDDLVIAPTFTYVATINPILYQNAIPILIDCDRETWNMDPQLVEDAIKQSKNKVKAIVVVHNYGMPADMEALVSLSEKYGIPLVEDAAEALGSRYNGRHVGGFGEIGILSFNNNKVLTTYGGGALLTNNETIYRKVMLWASQSRESKPYYEHKEVGYNYRLGALNAASGLAQWPHITSLVEKRRADFDRYRQKLEGHGFSFADERKIMYSNRWFSTAMVPGTKMAAKLHQNMIDKGIETRLLWNPMHKQPVFEKMKVYSRGESDRLFEVGICLPCGKNVTIEQQNEVIDTCIQTVEKGY